MRRKQCACVKFYANVLLVLRAMRLSCLAGKRLDVRYSPVYRSAWSGAQFTRYDGSRFAVRVVSAVSVVVARSCLSVAHLIHDHVIYARFL